MGRKKIGGFIFEWYAGDHRPYHIHVYQNNRPLGRFDLEKEVPMGDLEMTTALRRALILGGFIKGTRHEKPKK